METEKKTFGRDSKMEILRILSMIMIVMHHIACHGGYVFDGDVPAFNRIWVNLFEIGGKVGVNIFVMLSGYFLIKGSFHWKKVLRLVMVVFFYSALIYFCFLIAGKTEFRWGDFFHKMLPIMFNEYWFITAYVITYLLSPFLNKLVNSLKEKELLTLLAILITIQSVVPLFAYSYLSNVGWFLTIYLAGAFVRLYGEKWLSKTTINILVFVITYLIIFVVEAFSSWSIAAMYTIPCFVATLSLFCAFAFSKKHFSNKFVNVISATTLGIYLIHDNNLIRGFLWRELLHCPQMIYKTVLNAITKPPRESPSPLAKVTDSTSIPSIAPPKRIVRPLPTPEIRPP